MRDRHDREGLVLLHTIPTAEARRAAFRRGMASLALAARQREPVPLEGLAPDALLESIRCAWADGLLDELDWLTPASSAVAMFELVSALPLSGERRELAQRVADKLCDGSAETFVAIATSLALGTKRGPRGRAVRARLALALELGSADVPGVDDLALALVSRRDMVREWLHAPARGGLASRRSAAMLLERAALGATRLAAQGDPSALRVFELDDIGGLLTRLREDRAPGVAIAAARARGVLSAALPDLASELRGDLDPARGVVALRRGAISLAASIAVDPGAASEVMDLLRGPLVRDTPELAAAVVFGLRRAVEIEPEACRPILIDIATRFGLDALDAIVDLDAATATDLGPPLDAAATEGASAHTGERFAGAHGAGVRASLPPLESPLAIARERVAKSRAAGPAEGGLSYWLDALHADLVQDDCRGASLRERVRSALLAFARFGDHRAHEAATGIASEVRDILTELEALVAGDPADERRAFRLLRGLDAGVLAAGHLGDLLALKSQDGDVDALPDGSGGGDDEWLDQLARWLAGRERRPVAGDEDAIVSELELRALVHLADLDGVGGEGATDRTRLRRQRTFHALLGRARDERDRATAAYQGLLDALARAADAVVRDEGSEVCDVLVAMAMDLDDPAEIAAVADGTVVTELRKALLFYAELLRASRRVSRPSDVHTFLDHLLAQTRELPSASSPRLEALRNGFQRFARAALTLLSLEGLDELHDDGAEPPLAAFGGALQSVAQLVDGARRRRGETLSRPVPECRSAALRLDSALEKLTVDDDREAREQARGALELAIGAVFGELPPALAPVARYVLRHVAALPTSGPRSAARTQSATLRARETPLPGWIPPRRILGSYYVLHALGSGGASSVFVAKRLEERFDADAARFALKVPAYSGDVARTLSEEDFLQMFRDEAGALLALPRHENLARFVTFDSGARPKPILVMEYVEGVTLTRLLSRGRLVTTEAFAVVDGIAAGLAAMHQAGIGHLDLKPSNVILRRTPGADAVTPVLVDFGLAGRTVRPGCATLEYGAPEVWGVAPEGAKAPPMATDVYAFGALAYEVLTGRTLFEGRDEANVIVAHALHDGDPEGIRRLRTSRALAPLADVLSTALRRDPGARASIADVRAALSRVARELADHAWPLEQTLAASA